MIGSHSAPSGGGLDVQLVIVASDTLGSFASQLSQDKQLLHKLLIDCAVRR